MKLFHKNNRLLAVCNGSCIPLSEIPDEAFSSGMLGLGVGFLPSDDRFYCPADGQIQSIAEGKHAYTILTKEGAELLIHVGVDTVALKGEPFKTLVREGQTVRAGDPLVEVNCQKIRDHGLSDVTALLITNHEQIEILEYCHGQVTGGSSPALVYRASRKG